MPEQLTEQSSSIDVGIADGVISPPRREVTIAAELGIPITTLRAYRTSTLMEDEDYLMVGTALCYTAQGEAKARQWLIDSGEGTIIDAEILIEPPSRTLRMRVSRANLQNRNQRLLVCETEAGQCRVLVRPNMFWKPGMELTCTQEPSGRWVYRGHYPRLYSFKNPTNWDTRYGV